MAWFDKYHDQFSHDENFQGVSLIGFLHLFACPTTIKFNQTSQSEITCFVLLVFLSSVSETSKLQCIISISEYTLLSLYVFLSLSDTVYYFVFYF